MNRKLSQAISVNVPTIVSLVKAGTPQQNKYGKTECMYTFCLPSGENVIHYAKQIEIDTLKLFSVHENVQVVMRHDSFVDENGQTKNYNKFFWSEASGAQARAYAENPPLSVTKGLREERQLDSNKEAEEAKWNRIAVSKVLHEFMKAVYAKGIASNSLTIEKEVYEIVDLASQLTVAQFKALDGLYAQIYVNAKADDLPF